MKNSFKNLSFSEKKIRLDEMKRKYMDIRFQKVIGHIDNPLQIRIMRRQIARLNTLIHEQEILDKKAKAIEVFRNTQIAEAK